MKAHEWKQLSLRQRRARWTSLSPEVRATILSDESTRADLMFFAILERKYEKPSACTALYIICGCGVAGAAFTMILGQIAQGLGIAGAAFSLYVWTQMVEFAARTAFYAQQTAELIAHSNLAPAAPELVEPTAARLVADGDAALKSMRSVYGQTGTK